MKYNETLKSNTIAALRSAKSAVGRVAAASGKGVSLYGEIENTIESVSSTGTYEQGPPPENTTRLSTP